MSGFFTVTVTWMDDRKEVFSCNDIRVSDGVLYLNQARYPANHEPHRRIPLIGIREWTEVYD